MKELHSTKEVAQAFNVQGATVRRSVCVNGHYLGLRPVKLPNGRLGWSSEELQRLVESVAGAA